MEQGWHSGTYEVVNLRLIARGVGAVLPGGWKLAEMPEASASEPHRGPRPYGVIIPDAVRNTKFTNKTKYADVEFTFEVHADTFEELDGTVCPKVTAALQHAAITVGDGTVKVTMIRPGDIEYEKVEQIWTARLSFTVQVNQPALPTAT